MSVDLDHNVDPDHLTDPNQSLFPLLEEDPVFQRHLREERIAADLASALEPKLRQQMLTAIWETARDLIRREFGSLVESAVQRAMQHHCPDLELIKLALEQICENERHRRDEADWWKRSGEDEGDSP